LPLWGETLRALLCWFPAAACTTSSIRLRVRWWLVVLVLEWLGRVPILHWRCPDFDDIQTWWIDYGIRWRWWYWMLALEFDGSVCWSVNRISVWFCRVSWCGLFALMNTQPLPRPLQKSKKKSAGQQILGLSQLYYLVIIQIFMSLSRIAKRHEIKVQEDDNRLHKYKYNVSRTSFSSVDEYVNESPFYLRISSSLNFLFRVIRQFWNRLKSSLS
jgi:hypothetical protein